MIFSLFWEGAVYSRGSVYFKIRDFRGRLFEAGRLFEEIRYSALRSILVGLADADVCACAMLFSVTQRIHQPNSSSEKKSRKMSFHPRC